LKLTTKSEYSLLALIFMARQEKGGFVKAGKISAKYGMSKKYLESLLTTLKQSRFVEAKRSRDGGYRLAKPASKVVIADIVRLFDGALAPTASASKYFHASTPIEKEGKLMSVMREIREFTARKLEKLTLSDLI
jgi:Rrf2 family transcriptional regulator, cysteine metabolism repressor